MKKILNIALILIIVFSSAGYVFTYWQLKNIFRQTALRKVEQSVLDNQLQLIITSLDGRPLDLQNCIRENETEFRLNNEMYDIVRSEIRGKTIYNYCLKDNDENRLEATFVNYVEGNSETPAGTIPVKNILKNLSPDWEQPNNDNLLNTSSEEFVSAVKAQIIFIYIPVSIPPPKAAPC